MQLHMYDMLYSRNGVTVDGDDYSVRFMCLSCDLPARHKILNYKGRGAISVFILLLLTLLCL